MTEASPSIAPWEWAAVALAVAYLLLAIRQHIACWPAAILSSAIYTWLMYRVGLYMESGLQLFYIGMAVYGWYSWRSSAGTEDALPVSSWPPVFHVLPVALIAALSLTTGALLAGNTDAAFPYADSFTTWGAIVTTWMVARKILQNWYYWLVIDAVSMVLFLQRGLTLTAVLFGVYLVLIVIGLRSWRASYVAQ